MICTPQQIKEILMYQEVTEELLNELQQIGFKHKHVKHYDFRPKNSGNVGATWHRWDEEHGVITIYEGCEAGAVAHELAHGFHECLRRDFKLPDKFGEDYAEAIRWFVEARAGESNWSRGYIQNPRDTRILDFCDWGWSKFVANIKAHRFFPD